MDRGRERESVKWIEEKCGERNHGGRLWNDGRDESISVQFSSRSLKH